MSQQTDSSSSLLSLSIAAANAHPIPVTASNSTVNKHHRRLSSAGKTRRRLSDARDAANRPTSTAAAALSLASLSLSSSPPPTSHHLSPSLGTASNVLAIDSSSPTRSINLELSDSPTSGNSTASATLTTTTTTTTTPIPIANGKNRKRGVDHKCETCSKIYRHPSCLIKHRWEHTPHWREASKYVLSKHQQVQLLEAAAILSHLSPSSSSLPDDRSLWPSFLSGGSLPPPEHTNFTSYSPTAYSNHHTSTSYNPGYSPRQTNSVPALGTDYYRAPPLSPPNSGPVGLGLRDYPLPGSNGIGGDPAKVRPVSSPISAPARVSTAVLPKAPSAQVPPLAEEEEDPSNPSPRDCASSTSPEHRRSRSRSVSINSRSRSRSRSQSVSVSDEEMSSYTDQDKLWRGFAGRRYTDIEDLDDGVDWNDAYGRRINDKRRVVGQDRERVQEEWDGFELDMEMD